MKKWWSGKNNKKPVVKLSQLKLELGLFGATLATTNDKVAIEIIGLASKKGKAIKLLSPPPFSPFSPLSSLVPFHRNSKRPYTHTTSCRRFLSAKLPSLVWDARDLCGFNFVLKDNSLGSCDMSFHVLYVCNIKNMIIFMFLFVTLSGWLYFYFTSLFSQRLILNCFALENLKVFLFNSNFLFFQYWCVKFVMQGEGVVGESKGKMTVIGKVSLTLDMAELLVTEEMRTEPNCKRKVPIRLKVNGLLIEATLSVCSSFSLLM